MTARTVFIGNVAYDVTEEQLVEVMLQAGGVVNVRLVYDKDTGKANGYGFCEYTHESSALSAIRNLNGRVLRGRTLRVCPQTEIVPVAMPDRWSEVKSIMSDMSPLEIQSIPPKERAHVEELRRMAMEPKPVVFPTDQRALLDQVMLLTPEQIASLPPTDRAHVLELRKAMIGLRK